MPLIADTPHPLGIRQYCEQCTKCADACPPKALPFGEPSQERPNQSTIKGVKKWSADCEKCFGYWAKLKTDCAICMRVCPFAHRRTWKDRLWFRLATGRARRLAAWWDKKRGVAVRLKPGEWWARLRGDASD